MSLGYTLCFAVILAKTWRVYHIFTNPTAKKTVRTTCFIVLTWAYHPSVDDWMARLLISCVVCSLVYNIIVSISSLVIVRLLLHQYGIIIHECLPSPKVNHIKLLKLHPFPKVQITNHFLFNFSFVIVVRFPKIGSCF